VTDLLEGRKQKQKRKMSVGGGDVGEKRTFSFVIILCHRESSHFPGGIHIRIMQLLLPNGGSHMCRHTHKYPRKLGNITNKRNHQPMKLPKYHQPSKKNIKFTNKKQAEWNNVLFYNYESCIHAPYIPCGYLFLDKIIIIINTDTNCYI